MDSLCRKKARHCPILAIGMALVLLTVTPSPAVGDPAAPTSPPRGSEPNILGVDKKKVPVDSSSSETKWSTNDQPRVVHLRDGTSITIAPHSEVTGQSMAQIELGLKHAAPVVYCLELVKGTLDVEVAEDRLPSYGVLVRAPRKVGAIVKLGRGTITATASHTTVAARSGQDMMISVSEHWRSLRVGRAFSVAASHPSGSQRPILNAPRLVVDRPVLLALGPDLPRQHLRWQDVPGSKVYLVHIDQLTGSKPVLFRELHTARAEAVVDGLNPGRYSVMVAAIDAGELPSDFSPAVALRVVETVLPEGAYPTQNMIRLPVQERVLLRNTEGLELTYGSGNTVFVTAPGSVGLHENRSVLVRLREKGSTQETRLQLEPLDFALGVTLEPSRAIWPGPPVGIRVSMRRGDGTASPEIGSVTASVTINAQPVTAQWQRSHGELRGHVEKPPTKGPWVVRVVVQNRRGHVLARDFLEVAEQSPQQEP